MLGVALSGEANREAPAQAELSPTCAGGTRYYTMFLVGDPFSVVGLARLKRANGNRGSLRFVEAQAASQRKDLEIKAICQQPGNTFWQGQGHDDRKKPK
jgi:hypothetical protein